MYLNGYLYWRDCLACHFLFLSLNCFTLNGLKPEVHALVKYENRQA